MVYIGLRSRQTPSSPVPGLPTFRVAPRLETRGVKLIVDQLGMLQGTLLDR